MHISNSEYAAALARSSCHPLSAPPENVHGSSLPEIVARLEALELIVLHGNTKDSIEFAANPSPEPSKTPTLDLSMSTSEPSTPTVDSIDNTALVQDLQHEVYTLQKEECSLRREVLTLQEEAEERENTVEALQSEVATLEENSRGFADKQCYDDMFSEAAFYHTEYEHVYGENEELREALEAAQDEGKVLAAQKEALESELDIAQKRVDELEAALRLSDPTVESNLVLQPDVLGANDLEGHIQALVGVQGMFESNDAFMTPQSVTETKQDVAATTATSVTTSTASPPTVASPSTDIPVAELAPVDEDESPIVTSTMVVSAPVATSSVQPAAAVDEEWVARLEGWTDEHAFELFKTRLLAFPTREVTSFKQIPWPTLVRLSSDTGLSREVRTFGFFEYVKTRCGDEEYKSLLKQTYEAFLPGYWASKKPERKLGMNTRKRVRETAQMVSSAVMTLHMGLEDGVCS